MDDSNEWELSKENVQPLRQGRKVASLTSALQHTPADLQQIKEQRDVFEKQLRIYDGEDPLEIWDNYIKWTEQNFPRGGKDGNLMELLQRCLTHFKNHDGYKNDPRFVQIWIKFANFIDDPVEIYTYMFDQNIGCGLTMLYEEWANFLERLGNTKKADTIYLEGITRGAQPLDALRLKHSEFQMRVARGITLQPRGLEEDSQTEEEQRTVLGRLKADKKNRVGTFRTGTVKLGHARPLASSHSAPQQQTGPGFQVFQDENAPITSAPQQTGERRTIPVREQLNRENEQAPGVWTKARALQRKGVAAAAALPAQPAFTIHEDENARQQQHASGPVVDSHVLSTRKAEKPGHMLDPIRNTPSTHERPMYCKEKVYCGTQEFSFEEIRGLRYMERKQKQRQEEEQRRLAEQLKEMKLIRDQFQKDIQSMRAEQRQLLAMQRQINAQGNLSSCESSSVQPSPMCAGGSGGRFQPSHDTSSFSAPVSSAPSSASFSGPLPMAPSSASFSAPQSSAPSSASFSGPLPMAPSSASFSVPQSSAPSSASFSAHLPSASSVSSSANSSLHRQAAPNLSTSATGLQAASLNSSQKTPVLNSSGPSMPSSGSGSGGRFQLHQSRSAGPTPEGNTSRHSLTSTSPTINMKEALQMVQGMYNATLDCDKISAWTQEDTEMTEAVQAPTVAAPIVVFEEMQQQPTHSTAFPIFCDEKDPDQENRPPAFGSQMSGGKKDLTVPGRRKALQEKPISVPAAAPVECSAEAPSAVCTQAAPEDDLMGEGTEFYPHYDVTLAAVGSQDSFAAAARAASTPFGINSNDGGRLPSLPLSSIKSHAMTKENSDEEMADAASSCTDAQHSQNTQFHTFNNTRVTPNKNDLSPIIEGSSEGSSEESKSQAASTLGASAHTLTSTSTVKTPAVPSSRPHHATAPLASDVEMVSSDPPAEATDQHVIDTSHYVPPELDEKTEALLSMSVCIDPHSPFDEATISGFLKRIRPPLEQREGYVLCNQHVPRFSGCQFVNLGLDTYQLHRLIGEGGYAKVYHANSFNTNLDDSLDTMDIESSPTSSGECVIKVQKPSAPWEFYICSEVHQRLQKLGLAHMGQCMMEVSQGYFYQDGSCLVSDFCPLGSLLTLVNQIRDQRELVASMEPLAAFLTVHLLRIVEALHRCHIIHGDIKPDNILITGFPKLMDSRDREAVFDANSQCLRLVDFGQAIDMSLYAPGTTFMAKVGTSGFQCIEMMTDQPWTYQTDMFGLVGSLHVLVFGQYMKVYCSQGSWHMTSSFQRKWKVDLWKKLFHQLLNIPDCDHQPDLGALRREFEDHFLTNLAPHFHKVVARVQASVRATAIKQS